MNSDMKEVTKPNPLKKKKWYCKN